MFIYSSIFDVYRLICFSAKNGINSLKKWYGKMQNVHLFKISIMKECIRIPCMQDFIIILIRHVDKKNMKLCNKKTLPVLPYQRLERIINYSWCYSNSYKLVSHEACVYNLLYTYWLVIKIILFSTR